MFEKEAEEIEKEAIKWVKDVFPNDEFKQSGISRALVEFAELGYNKANEWHRVSDKLPKMDMFVYLWKEGDDFPVVACRHIFCGQKEWVWDCMWGSGYTMSKSKGEDYLWKEIVLPKEIKEKCLD